MMILGGLLALRRALAARLARDAVPGLSGMLRETGGIRRCRRRPTTWLFTMHATIMIFFVIIPILAGASGTS